MNILLETSSVGTNADESFGQAHVSSLWLIFCKDLAHFR